MAIVFIGVHISISELSLCLAKRLKYIPEEVDKLDLEVAQKYLSEEDV